jgi:hypothetical protein
MDEPIITFGVLMGMEAEEAQDKGAGDPGSNVLLIFCPTGESEEGKIIVTQRMLDLEFMGMRPVAITRWNPEDTRYYAIFAKEGLSESLTNAVLNEAGSLVREALLGSELLNYSSTDNSSY